MEDIRNSAYDYACCERVWRRVAPQENPYPEARAAATEKVEQTEQPAALPAAIQNDSCCMGTAAGESLEVIRGFVRDELAARQTYLCAARCAPSQEVRRTLHRMAHDEESHARQLMAAIYLATGEVDPPHVCADKKQSECFCAMLGHFYAEVACGGFNYFRAGEETLDYCMGQMFTAMSQDEYRHARMLLNMLSRMMKA